MTDNVYSPSPKQLQNSQLFIRQIESQQKYIIIDIKIKKMQKYDKISQNQPNKQYLNKLNLNKKINFIIFIFILLIGWILLIHFELHHAQILIDNLGKIKEINNLHDNNNLPLNQDLFSNDNNLPANKKDISLLEYIGFDRTDTSTQKAQNKNEQPLTKTRPKGKQGSRSAQKNTVNRQVYSKSLNIKDFEVEQVYRNAPANIKNTFNQMIRRPSNKRTKPTRIFMPTQKAYFAYHLYQHPQNKLYQQAQQYYYQYKYQLSKYDHDQLPICIVAPGRNIAQNKKFIKFVDSIQRQNYTNFIFVYVDDVSNDSSAQLLQQYVKKKQSLLSKSLGTEQIHKGSFIINEETFNREQNSQRMIIIKNKQRIYALANRNKGIKKYCKQNSIILDADADDSLIGRQVFRFINTIYHDKKVWMFNSVFIYDKSPSKQVTTGPQDPVPFEILEKGNYRTSFIWKSCQLRTFRSELYNKIDQNDFKMENGKFYQWASDVFMQQPLTQLAGPLHYKHLYQILYFYDWNFNKTTVFKRRHYRDIVFMQTPYKPLNNLNDIPQKIQNYQPPKQITMQFQKNINQARKQAIKYKRPPPF